MTALLRAVGTVLSSGRFVSRWTFVAIVGVSVTVLAPLPETLSEGERLAVGALAALPFAGAWALVGLVERAVFGRAVRASIVVGTLVVASIARPAVQDAVSQALGLAIPSADATPLRAATNLVVWTIALGGTAALVDLARSTRETNALLREVLAQLEGGADRVRRYSDLARADTAAAADALEAPRPATVAGVRSLAVDLRAHAHALSTRAEERLTATSPASPAPAAARVAGTPFRLPPVGLPAAIYSLAVLPYALRSVSPLDLVIGLLAALVCGGAGDLLARRAVLRRRHVASTVVFLAGAMLTGLALGAVAIAQGVALPLAIIPVLAYPALSAALARGRGALRTLTVERRRLSTAIGARARADDLGTRRVRAGLHEAAELLHRDAQGAAVRLTLQQPQPTEAEITAFLAGLRPLAGAVRGALDAPAAVSTAVPLDPLLQTWGRAMPVRADIGDDARNVLLGDPGLARDVVDVVAEGLLNVAKHARVRTADIEVRITPTAAGPRLRVRVMSPGAPSPRARLRADSRAHLLGARLTAAADTAVLEAVFAVAHDTAASGSVVSTDHFRGGVSNGD